MRFREAGFRLLFEVALLGVMVTAAQVTSAQEPSPSPTPMAGPTLMASPTPMPSPTPIPSPTPMTSPPLVVQPQALEPLYTNYRGVSIGMSTEEARTKLGAPKSRGQRQDFFVFSDQESAQVFYVAGKVSAISVDYVGADSGAPAPMDVFGIEVKPRKNGSIYKIVRYPKARYWVAYNRTTGKNPIISITMRRMR